MNDLQLKILNTLKQACASPIVAQSGDEQLQAHLGEMGTLATYLLTEMVDVPELKKRALREYADLASETEKFLSSRNAATIAAQELARLAALENPAQFDDCLTLARDIQLALNFDDVEAAALQKNLALVEGNHGKRVIAAMAEHAPRDSAHANAVGQAKRFDERKLNDFIVRAFPEEQNLRVAESKFISGGSSKYTMAIRLDGVRAVPEELILRGDSASSADYGGASVVEEFRLLQQMYAHGVCVAKPLAVEPSGEVFGTPFMLVERRPGNMIGHMFNLPQPNKITGRDVAEKLAAIHRVPIDAIGDWIRGAGMTTSAQVAATLDQSYASWQALRRPSPIYEAAFKWLRANVAVMDRSRGLVHGDYGLNNLLIENDRVSAILDWEFTHVGNPAYDLGYFYYQAESLASWQEFLDAYQAAGGILPSTEEIDYSILFAATRLGVMLCQAEAAFSAGVMDGLFISLAVGRNCHSVSLTRLSGLLERLL